MVILNSVMQFSNWGNWSQNSSSDGQWCVRLSQPWLFDRFHLLSFSEISDLTTCQSCRPASSTPWLCWRNCTYFRWLWRYLLPYSSSRWGKRKCQMPPPPFPRKVSRSLVVLSFSFPLSLALAWFGLRFELLIRWFRPIIEQLCNQLYSASGGEKKNNTEFEASA